MNLVDRVKNIIVTPKTEWTAIDAEPETIADIYKSYVAPLAAIPAVCGFIGTSIVGMSVFGTTFRVPILNGLASAVFGFALSLALVYVLSLIIDALAPTFGGTKNPLSAFKVAAYSYTPAWLAGIFTLTPFLSILAIVGLYSVYLLYLGLPRLMRSPEDKAVGYTAVIIVIGILLSLVIGGILTLLFGGR